MYSFERLKEVLKKREEERFEALKKEINHLKAKIERGLEMFFECSASKSQTRYSGLEMY